MNQNDEDKKLMVQDENKKEDKEGEDCEFNPFRLKMLALYFTAAAIALAGYANSKSGCKTHCSNVETVREIFKNSNKDNLCKVFDLGPLVDPKNGVYAFQREGCICIGYDYGCDNYLDEVYASELTAEDLGQLIMEQGYDVLYIDGHFRSERMGEDQYLVSYIPTDEPVVEDTKDHEDKVYVEIGEPVEIVENIMMSKDACCDLFSAQIENYFPDFSELIEEGIAQKDSLAPEKVLVKGRTNENGGTSFGTTHQKKC